MTLTNLTAVSAQHDKFNSSLSTANGHMDISKPINKIYIYIYKKKCGRGDTTKEKVAVFIG